MTLSIENVVSISPIVPVIGIDNMRSLPALGEALTTSGLGIAEITLRTPQALEAIRELSRDFPALVVGAGTVLTPRDVDAVIDAGARFIVSPGLTPSLQAAASASDVAFLPGVSTPGECMTAMDHGLRYLKFFPAAASGGVSWLKAVGAALGELRFCPTGGIGPGNVQDYLGLENVCCVGGSWLIPGAALQGADAGALTRTCREALGLARLTS